MRLSPRLMRLAALPATAALLAACSPTGPGPLGDGGTAGQQRMPFAQGKPVTVGLYDLKNSGSTPVTVRSVKLGSPHGVTMTRAWLVPLEHVGQNIDVVGVGYPYPPDFSRPVRWAWAHRVPAVGAIIRPGQDLNLVFGMTKTTSRTGRSNGPVTVYTADGNTYTVQEKVTLVVAAKHC